jgi:hypothetical protein
MKYTMFLLVSGLLVLAILPGSVFAGGPQTNYDITIEIDGDEVTTFTTTGQANRSGIKFDGMRPVALVFPSTVLDELQVAEEVNRPRGYLEDRALNWSPLEDDWLDLLPEDEDPIWNRFDLDPNLQDLNDNSLDLPETWRFHGGELDYKNKTLYMWFRRFLYYYTPGGQGAVDEYGFAFTMENVGDASPYMGETTLGFGHYTYTVSKKPGRKLDVPSQKLRDNSSHMLIITIELNGSSKPAAPPAQPSTWGQIKSLLR